MTGAEVAVPVVSGPADLAPVLTVVCWAWWLWASGNRRKG